MSASTPAGDSEPVNVVIGADAYWAANDAPPGWGDGPSDDPSFHGRYNDSIFLPDPEPADAWIFTVAGRAISIHGISPPKLAIYNQTIGIANPDDAKADPAKAGTYARYTWPAPAIGGELYSSGRLPADTKQLKLGLLGYRGMAFNYVLYEAVELTDLAGQTILVDDTSKEISWRGNGWKTREAEEYKSATRVQCELIKLLGTGHEDDEIAGTAPFNATMFPHGNSTHVSGTTGDGFEFRFAGTSIDVYGVSPGPIDLKTWRLTMSFSIDNTQNSTISYTSGFQPDRNTGSALTTHFLYFSAKSLSAGNHSLVATIVDVAGVVGEEGTMAHIDYLTYEPSFTTLRDKPSFATSAGNESDTGGAGEGATLPGTGGGDQAGTGKARSPVAAIVGGVLGAVILAALIILGLVCVRRRRRRRTREQRLSQVESDFTQVQEPFAVFQPSLAAMSETSSITQKQRAAGSLQERSPRLEPQRARSGSGPTSTDSSPFNVPSSEHAGGGAQVVELDTRVRDLQREVDLLRMEIAPPRYE
ncbi:Gpr1 family protein [Mycena kentingensis (nom. inval.)]|nr:Gpr1 family protein [Mycena kentingensis (nom. inval.)]